MGIMMHLLFIILLLLFKLNVHAVQIQNVKFPSQVTQYEKFEAHFIINTQYTNPFDPDEVDVTGEITAPSGKILNLPAFYTQDFDRLLEEGIEKFSANGGMLNKSMEFFTNAEANKFFDNRIRYIIARWGYSPHILAWELWNEVDGILGYYGDNNVENVKLWHEDKIKKIRVLDVHQHLVTTSFAFSYFLDKNQFWDMEGIDYTQYHAYLGPVFGIEYPMVESARTLSQFNKPTFAGEFGIDWLGAFNKDDPQGINIHNGIWSSLLSGNAGGGMSWWWYNYIEPNNLWGILRSLSEFVKNEDLTEFTEVFTEGLGIDNPSLIEVIGIRSEKNAFFWVHDKESV